MEQHINQDHRHQQFKQQLDQHVDFRYIPDAFDKCNLQTSPDSFKPGIMSFTDAKLGKI